MSRLQIMNWSFGAAALAFAFALAGCTPQSDLQQLNQNEFALRGMIASDRQQIDSLQQQLKRQNDEITELKHGAGTGAGGDAGRDSPGRRYRGWAAGRDGLEPACSGTVGPRDARRDSADVA